MSEKTASKERYPRNSQQTRARILHVASELFSRVAYDNVRSRDIAQKAGVDVALINRYFGSKKQLFQEVFNGFLNRRSQAAGLTLEERVGHIFDQHFEDNFAQDKLDALSFLTLSANSPEVGHIVVEHFMSAIEEISANLERHSIADRDGAKTISTAILTYLIGAHVVFRIMPKEERDKLDRATLLEPLLALLKSKNTPAHNG